MLVSQPSWLRAENSVRHGGQWSASTTVRASRMAGGGYRSDSSAHGPSKLPALPPGASEGPEFT